MGQQLLALATTDMLLSTWVYVVPCVDSGELLWSRSPRWCATFMTAQRFLQLTSGSFSATLALGLLAEVLDFQRVLKMLHFAPLAIIPTTAFLCRLYRQAPYFVPATQFPLGSCWSTYAAEQSFAAEVCAIFSTVAVLEMLIVHRAWVAAPGSVVRRAAKAASVYNLAFFASYIVFVFTQVYGAVFTKQTDEMHCATWTGHVVRAPLCIMSGLFNYLAFREHSSQVASSRAVHFSRDSGVDVQEFQAAAFEAHFGDLIVVSGRRLATPTSSFEVEMNGSHSRLSASI
eukprot:NODE_934_length_1306_cov_334.266187.p1 GENE.NODE_934_length_1306_cov_334.266187~~NODE_934_length_1306_cov_334.266187.p1  ORF type:complete len:287 (+),score=61.65 NODE_934_length_1306_cov_334.266187:3-863(+)